MENGRDAPFVHEPPSKRHNGTEAMGLYGVLSPASGIHRTSSLLETEAYQEHEDDDAEFVIVCQPGLSKLMMDDIGSLYEKPVNTSRSIEQHRAFVRVLEENGVTVFDVREILMMDTSTSVGARLQLEEFAASRLSYLMDKSCESRIREGDEYYISNEYKKKVLAVMSAEQLVDIIMTNPTVTILPSGRDTYFTASYSFQPLSNAVFTRDQQVTTRKGIVMANLSSLQRHREVDLMRFCFQKLGLPVIAEIPDEGRLEGGDFFPAGEELCFVGVGLRSNIEAIEFMLKNDLFGTRRVAVVHDRFDRHQDRMHLDCVFNVLGRDVCLMYEPMMGEKSPIVRTVDEYVQEVTDSKVTYRKLQTGIEFSAYLRQNGFHIIPLTHEQQAAYGCNALNLGHSNLIVVNEEAAREIARSPHFRGRVRHHDFSSITSMYGAVHCATQVVRRRREGFAPVQSAAPAATAPGTTGLDVLLRLKRKAPSG